MPFKTWLQVFDNYLLVINATGNAWPAARKRAVLLHCIGAEGQRIFHSLPDTGDTYDSAVAALKAHFIPMTNVVVERHTFRKRAQGPHETVSQYVAALRELASSCDFGDKADEMLRDQLIQYVTNAHIREKLLLEPNLTLDRAITIATQIESAAEQAKRMAGDRPSLQVQAVQKKSFRPRQQYKPSTHAPSPTAASRKSSRACFRCGSDSHLANAPSCPAAKATCKSCHKKGHFARVCRSTSTHQVREVEVPELTVLRIQKAACTSDKIKCNVKIQPSDSPAHAMDLIVDSASPVSILPRSVYDEHFGESQLTPPSIRLAT